MDSNIFQLKSSTLWKTYRWVLVTWGFLLTYFQPSVGLFFLGIPHEQSNIGHWSYLFKMWTQEQLRDLTTQKVIEERFALFQIKQHYNRQNLDPPAAQLADLELLMKKLRPNLNLSKSF